ncbi:MAG: hypothetical protein GF335_00885 [Candidatus Moranbacteria bacterium]|nr:hypothetical protein [Candidatus Moranbacteria bacterium]
MLKNIYKKIEQKDYKTREKIRNIFIALAFLLIIASWIIYNKYFSSQLNYEKISNNQIIISGQKKLQEIDKAGKKLNKLWQILSSK